MASENLFLSDHNAKSLRRAVVEDDGDVAAADWALLWSQDGHSVAVLADDFPLACIVNAINPGYSRGLTAPTSLGNTWDDLMYARIFGRV